MLRRMLIVLSLYPIFIHRCQKWCDLNPSIPLDLQNQISFLERYKLPKLMQLPISALMESALSAMDIFAQLNLLGRISFDYSPDFRILFVNLHRGFTKYYIPVSYTHLDVYKRQVLTQMQDTNRLQALSLTQNLSLGTYLHSVSLHVLNFFLYRLNGSSYSPSSSGSKFFPNTFGFNRGDLAFKLLSYLGYGNILSSTPSSGSRWWSTSLKNDTSSSYTQAYIPVSYTHLDVYKRQLIFRTML